MFSCAKRQGGKDEDEGRIPDSYLDRSPLLEQVGQRLRSPLSEGAADFGMEDPLAEYKAHVAALKKRTERGRARCVLMDTKKRKAEGEHEDAGEKFRRKKELIAQLQQQLTQLQHELPTDEQAMRSTGTAKEKAAAEHSAEVATVRSNETSLGSLNVALEELKKTATEEETATKRADAAAKKADAATKETEKIRAEREKKCLEFRALCDARRVKVRVHLRECDHASEIFCTHR